MSTENKIWFEFNSVGPAGFEPVACPSVADNGFIPTRLQFVIIKTLLNELSGEIISVSWSETGKEDFCSKKQAF